MKQRRTWLIVGLLLAIVALAAIGLHLSKVLKEDYLDRPAPVSETTLDAHQVVYPVIITDSVGRDVEIKARPERIISLGPNMTEFIWDLGLGDRQVGRTTYCDYPKEVEAVETVGTLRELDLEKIAELKPDLVLASTHVKDEIIEAIDKLGIPVLLLYEDSDYMGVVDIYEALGEALDVEALAAQKAEAFKAAVADVEAKVKGAKAPKVYYVVGFGEYGEYTPGGNTFVSGLLTAAGGDNVAKDLEGWSYSLEKLVEADPEVVIVADWAKEEFETTAPYSELKAVKDGRVFVIDKNLIDRQGPRNQEGLLELAKRFHPELFD